MASKGPVLMEMILAAFSLVLSLAFGLWCFLGIVRGYRRTSGLPWLESLGFAAAATAAIFALHALLSP
jgi:hypothetical protein